MEDPKIHGYMVINCASCLSKLRKNLGKGVLDKKAITAEVKTLVKKEIEEMVRVEVDRQLTEDDDD